MIYILINALAIGCAAAAALVVGWLFDRLAGGDRGRGPGWTGLAVMLLAHGWFAAILAGALILAPPEAGRWTMAIGTAVVIWAGFIVPVLIVGHVRRALGRRALLVDAGYWLGAALVMAAVLQAIGLTPPPA